MLKVSWILIFELAGLAFVLIYLICLIWKRNSLIMQCRNEALGTVEGIEVTESGAGNTFRLLVIFDTGSGTVRRMDAWKMTKCNFSRGDPVTVRYNPDKPDIFYVVENQYSTFVIKLLTVLALLYPGLIILIYMLDK